MNDGIPIREFVALEKEARKALVRDDQAGIDAINERLAVANCRLIVRDGRLHIKPLSSEGAPDDDD